MIDANKKVGPGSPPEEHQFKKGRSGNPRGRPRKAERAFVPRQVRRDVLGVTERPRRVRTAEGVKSLPGIALILEKIFQKALEGHGPSLRFIVNLHFKVIEAHAAAHPEFDILEFNEKLASLDQADMKTPSAQSYLNSYRRGTRKP